MKIISCILLVLTIGLTLLSCADTADAGTGDTTTAATTAATTVDRDTLIISDLSEIEVEIITAMWNQYKDNAILNNPSATINSISLDRFFEPCGEGYVLYVIDFIPPADSYYSETIAGYEFRYTSILPLSFYSNGTFESLRSAYTDKKMTEDELRTIWEAHKAKNPGIYADEEWNGFQG